MLYTLRTLCLPSHLSRLFHWICATILCSDTSRIKDFTPWHVPVYQQSSCKWFPLNDTFKITSHLIFSPQCLWCCMIHCACVRKTAILMNWAGVPWRRQDTGRMAAVCPGFRLPPPHLCAVHPSASSRIILRCFLQPQAGNGSHPSQPTA